jgi:hypothetical protein
MPSEVLLNKKMDEDLKETKSRPLMDIRAAKNILPTIHVQLCVHPIGSALFPKQGSDRVCAGTWAIIIVHNLKHVSTRGQDAQSIHLSM